MNVVSEVAVLDTCVLYPPRLRDLLLYLAEYELYEPRWTPEILDEREHLLRKRRRDLKETQINSVTTEMNGSFPAALVEVDYSLFEYLHLLPDANDMHVLIGAIYGGASVIVTFNLTDFPKKILSKFNIRAEHPDIFCSRLIESNSQAAGKAFLHQ